MGSATVRVYNDGVATYVERYKNQDIEIPPKGFLVMKKRDAIDFLGTMSQPLPNGGWVEKNLSLHEDPASIDDPPQKYVCNFDGLEFPTQEALDQHLLQHSKEDSKVIACPMCDFKARSDAGLKAHIRQKHSEE